MDTEVTLTTNTHKNVTNKTLKLPNPIEDPTKHLNYKNEKRLVFSGIYWVLDDKNLHEKSDQHEITKGDKFSLLNIDAYLEGQLSEKIYV